MTFSRNKTKILIVLDSFKGSISSKEAAAELEEGIKTVSGDFQIIKIPLADGGEGTVEAVIESVGGKYCYKVVNDPLFRKVEAKYGIFDHGKSAVIEMASASGLQLLKNEERNPLSATTYGTGELILDALDNGAENIVIGIGGSATNDGGVGMASALGVKFFDEKNKVLPPIGDSLNRIASIDVSGMTGNLKKAKIKVICDVTNPLFGYNGAAFVYGAQKGASIEEIRILDTGLKNLSKIVKKDLKLSYQSVDGSGAAGGLGYGLMVFCGAELTSGIDYLIDLLDLEEKIKTVDYVITGEGRLDKQTTYNKAPWGIMKIARKNGKKVIAVAGLIDASARGLLTEKFDSIHSLSELAASKEDSIQNSAKYLRLLGKKIALELL